MWNSCPVQKIFSESRSTCSGVRDNHYSPCFPPSAPPLPWADPDLSADSPLNSLLGLFESHSGVKTGICRIKDFDWLSGNALESSGVMGGRTRGEKTDGEKLRWAEKIMNWDNYRRGREEEEAAASDQSYNHLQQSLSACMCVKTGKQITSVVWIPLCAFPWLQALVCKQRPPSLLVEYFTSHYPSTPPGQDRAGLKGRSTSSESWPQ